MARLTAKEIIKREKFMAKFYEILPIVSTQSEAYRRAETWMIKEEGSRLFKNYKSFHRSMSYNHQQ